MRENVELWLKQSLEDLDTAKVLLNNNKYYASTFYSHQAAEKALKALLLNVEEIRKEALKLNPNYTISRYPDILMQQIVYHIYYMIKMMQKSI